MMLVATTADLSGVEGAQGLKPWEFYLRDYNQRELVNALVDEELIEPVADYSPVQSGYVNFWVYPYWLWPTTSW